MMETIYKGSRLIWVGIRARTQVQCKGFGPALRSGEVTKLKRALASLDVYDDPEIGRAFGEDRLREEVALQGKRIVIKSIFFSHYTSEGATSPAHLLDT